MPGPNEPQDVAGAPKLANEQQPVDIIRWPNLEHRFTTDSPVHVNFNKSPLQVGFTEAPANVNMNIVTPNAVGVTLLGTKEPVALAFVLPRPIVARSDYSLQLQINGKEVFSVAIAGTTTFFSQGDEPK